MGVTYRPGTGFAYFRLHEQLIAVALQLGGMPIPQGGGSRLADALTRLIRDCGGSLQSDAHVDSVEVDEGRAVGVRVKGSLLKARRAVI